MGAAHAEPLSAVQSPAMPVLILRRAHAACLCFQGAFPACVVWTARVSAANGVEPT